jgi:hypothetical protein
MKTKSSLCSVRGFYIFGVSLALGAAPAIAEEGGSGHYFPGSMASFIDGVPSNPTALMRLNVLSYSGDVDKNLTVPIAGLAASDVDIDVFGVGLTALWSPDWDLGRWHYAMSVTVPVVDISVEAAVSLPNDPLNRGLRRSDSASGLGDILFLPIMFNYVVSPALNANLRLGVYAPTGDYETGRLANTGKNFWTLEPVAALVYLDPETGIEASTYFGLDFNTENPDTDYKSGTQAHLEGTFAQHFPLWGGLAGVGLTGYIYQQLTGDSGDGAIYGDFKARSIAWGPVASYSNTLGGHALTAEFKWLHETEVERRAEGDTLFLKVVYSFY